MKKIPQLLAEIILIVIGVLLALMIDNAVQERNENQMRQEYLSRIKDDLEFDKQAIQYRIEFFTDVRDFSLQLLRWLETDLPVDQAILLASYYSAEIWPFEPRASTYEDLKSTGNIRLFESIEFRSKLATYYTKAKSAEPYIKVSTDFRRIIRGTIPNELQSRIAGDCPTTDALDNEPTGFPACPLHGIDYDELTVLFAPLKQDARFKRVLTYRVSELRTKNYLLAAQSMFADDVLRGLD